MPAPSVGDQFRGMYLDGSLAWGGFNPETSDIDCIVTTDDALADDRFLALSGEGCGVVGGKPIEGTRRPAQERRHILGEPGRVAGGDQAERLGVHLG